MTMFGIGALALFAWLLLGLLFVQLWRPSQGPDTLDALANMMLWPLGVVAQFVVWPLVKGRKERARQARITVAVENNEYTAEFARRSLNWKG